MGLISKTRRPLTLGEVIEAWAGQVKMLAADVAASVSDRTAGDFEGVLYARNRVQEALRRVFPEHDDPPTLVAALDEVFRLATEDLSGTPAQWLSDAAPEQGQWWWSRVPLRGAMRREIDEIIAWLESQG